MENTQKVTHQNSIYKGQSNSHISDIYSKNNDIKGVRLTQKTQKIVTALYMVTEYLENIDPLKTSVRKKGLELFETVSMIASGEVYQLNLHHHTCDRLLREIVSSIQIAGMVGSMSHMNVSILEKELHVLFDLVVQYVSKRESEFMPNMMRSRVGSPLSEAFFSVSDPVYTEDVPHIKDTQKSVVENKGHVVEKMLKNTSEATAETAVKTDRKMSIMKVIQVKREATIKDITSVVRECSEKTIQRELMTLVADGVLKKTGDKRWSKYSFA